MELQETVLFRAVFCFKKLSVKLGLPGFIKLKLPQRSTSFSFAKKLWGKIQIANIICLEKWLTRNLHFKNLNLTSKQHKH